MRMLNGARSLSEIELRICSLLRGALRKELVFPCGNALKMEQRIVVVEFRWVGVGEFLCLR